VSGTVTTGWHSDPFGVHEARYFSADGQPTKLVRDRGTESYDEPPSGADEVAAAMARMSAAPGRATARRLPAPPAARTVSFDAFLEQLGQNPALKQLEQTSAS
jgi:hypothetical protein